MTRNQKIALVVIGVLVVVGLWYYARAKVIEDFVTKWESKTVGCRTAQFEGIYLIQDKKRRWFDGTAWAAYRKENPTAPQFGNRLSDDDCAILSIVPAGTNMTAAGL